MVTRALERRNGQVLITVALMLTVLLAFLALAIDVAYLYAQRRQMQNAADAGALAGARTIVVGDTDAEIEAAIDQYATGENPADAFTAFYIPSGHEVGAGFKPPDATGVRVVAEATVPTFFAGLFGLSEISIEGSAEGGFAPLDIMVVLDRSGSMDDDSCSMPWWWPWWIPTNRYTCERWGGVWQDPPQPIGDAKDAAKAFVDMNNPNLTHLGLVSYAKWGRLDQSLTADFATVKSAIDGLTADGCTNAEEGIQKARAELNASPRSGDALPFIVFLTDGLPNYPYCRDCRDHCLPAKDAARDEARQAANEGIAIYTIALGDKADRDLMQDIADLTGGESFYAPSSDDLLTVYQTIFEQIQLRLIE